MTRRGGQTTPSLRNNTQDWNAALRRALRGRQLLSISAMRFHDVWLHNRHYAKWRAKCAAVVQWVRTLQPGSLYLLLADQYSRYKWQQDADPEKVTTFDVSPAALLVFSPESSAC